jgi:hypothetical protein
MALHSPRKNIVVISSFAKDEIINLDTRLTRIKRGGPAFFISQALRKIGATPTLITGDKESSVRIVVERKEEKGEIIYTAPIILSKEMTADLFIVSTIGEEFELKDIKKFSGIIAVDGQGYVRKYKAKNKKLMIPREIGDKISVLKITDSEILFFGKRFLTRQKNRILLITCGRKGFEIYAFGGKYIHRAKEIAVDDAVGAGDTLFATFCFSYLNNRDARRSATFAKAQVENFLRNKR